MYPNVSFKSTEIIINVKKMYQIFCCGCDILLNVSVHPKNDITQKRVEIYEYRIVF